MRLKFEHVGISTRNLDRAVAWYRDVFGFEEVRRYEKADLEIKGALLKSGDCCLEILEPYTPEELGPKISTAFLATMYGVALANLVYLPFAGRLKAKAGREKMINDLIVEGLLSIQAGENPRIIKEKLNLALLEKLNKKKGTSSAGEKGETEE